MSSKIPTKKQSKKITTQSTKKTNPTTPENDYIKMCQAKRTRNHKHLEKVLEDIKMKRKKISYTPTNSPKNTTAKAGVQGCKSPSQKNTVKKKVPLSKTITRKSIITKKCTHNDILAFNEEADRRYFVKGWDLHGSKCMSCNIKFGEGTNMPSITQPVYICNNRIATGCKNAFCQDCYLMKMKSDGNNKRSRRTRKKLN